MSEATSELTSQEQDLPGEVGHRPQEHLPALTLEVLNEIGQAISSTIELDDLLTLIYQQTGRLMDTSDCFIAIYEQGSDEWTSAFHFEHGRRQPVTRQKAAAGLTGDIIRSPRPILLRSQQESIAFLQTQGIEIPEEPARSWLGVPLIAQKHVVGVIAVQSYSQEGLYDESHLHILSTIASQAAVAIQNARLYQEARRRIEEMEALYRIGATSVLRLSLEEILQSVYEQAGVVMDTSAFYVALYDREQDEIHAELLYDRGEKQPPYRTKKSEQGGLIGWILDRGGALLVRDWEQEATEEMRRAAIDMEKEPVRSWLSVPLVVRGEVVGIITVQSYRAGAFDEHHRRVLEMIAHQAAAAIENARLLDEAQHHWREVEVLLEVSRTLGTLLDPQELLHSVLEIATRTVPRAERGSVFLQDLQTGELVIRAQQGYPPEVVDQVHLQPDEGLAGWVFQQKRSDVVFDPRQDPRFKDFPASSEIRSMMAAPLIGRAGVIGVISLDNCSQEGAFRRADLQLLDGLAQQVSAALENARLFAEARRRLGELTALNAVGRAISSTMELDQVLELIYEQTSRLMDTTSFYIALCDWEQGLLNFVLRFEDGQRGPQNTQPITAGLSGYITRTGEPLLFPYGPDEFLQAQGIARVGRPSKSWVGVPMIAQERVIGVIAVQSFVQGGAYDEGHLRVLSTIASQAAAAVENARLYQEARRRIEEMEALYRIGATSASHLSLEEILESVREQAGVVMDTSIFHVALYDRERDEIAFELDYEKGVRQEPNRASKSGQGGLTGWILDHGGTLLIRDWEQEATEEMRRVVLDMREEEPVRSWLSVPLLVRGELIGVITAQSFRAEAFDEHHRRVLEMIAYQAAAAVQNARLYQEAQRRVSQLFVLQQIGLKLAATTDLSEVLNAVAEAAIELFRPTNAQIFLFDAIQQAFTLASGLNQAGERGLFSPMPRKDGLTATVAHTGKPMVVDDVTKHPLYASDPEQARQLRSIASVPLVRASQTLGVLNVSYDVPHRFALEEVGLLQTLADQAAVAVANANLFQQTQAVMRELQETAETQSELLQLIQEMSTPVVPLLEGVLLMPLVGSIDSQRGRQTLERLLQVAEQQRAQIVLVDITGVPVVDTSVAQILLQAVLAVRLLGGEAVLVGIRPEVAQTLVSLGVDLAGIATRADLQGGLAYAMRRVGRKPIGGTAPSPSRPRPAH